MRLKIYCQNQMCNTTHMFATYTTRSAEETIALGKKLARRLVGGDTVLLYGELGSGKTHFTKGIAEGLGIEMRVKSPTFALVNRYSIEVPIEGLPTFHSEQAPIRGTLGASPIEGQFFCHYDLYRLEDGSDLTSIGFEETLSDPRAINVIEWADRLGDALPSHFVQVNLEGVDDKRMIQIAFSRSSMVPDSEVETYFEEWVTPLHVREHCRQVARVAQQIGDSYARAGEIMNMNLLVNACLLHDLCRLCDFKTLDRDRFEEAVTDEKWAKWVKMREQYKGIHHADIGDQFLKEKGYHETAECVRLHKFVAIGHEQAAFDTLEKKITYYADKRVKHTEIVTLEERFRDGRIRHTGGFTDQEKAMGRTIEKRAFELERELFDQLDIEPGSPDHWIT